MSWRAHPRRGRHRRRPLGAGRGPGPRRPQDDADGTAVTASMRGFTDAGCAPAPSTATGSPPSTAPRTASAGCPAGIDVPAVPTPEPGVVTDLTAELPAGRAVPADETAPSTAQVVLSWTPPRHGHVRLVRADHAPGWQVGARVAADPDTLTDVPGHPEHDAGRPRRTAGQAAVRAPLRHRTDRAGPGRRGWQHRAALAARAGPRGARRAQARHRRAELGVAARRHRRHSPPSRRRAGLLPARLLRRGRLHASAWTGTRSRSASSPCTRGRTAARWPHRPGSACQARPAAVQLPHPPAAAACMAAGDRGLRRGNRPAAAAGGRADYRPVPAQGPGRRRADPGNRPAAGRPGPAGAVHRAARPPGPRLGGLLR